MPFRQSGKNPVFVGYEGSTSIGSGLVGRCVAVCQHQQRQRLVFLTDQLNHGKPRPRPCDSFDIEPRSQVGKGGQHPFHKGAMPAIEPLAGIGGIFKIRA